METRVLRQKNMQVDVSNEVPEPPNKRRRAAFGNLTNKESLKTAQDGKKKAVVKKAAAATVIENKKPVAGRPKPALRQSSNTKPTAVIAPTKASHAAVTKEEIKIEEALPVTVATSQTIEDDDIIDLCTRFDFIDVDKDNRDSPFHITEYVNDIFKYYKVREMKFAISDYMSTQIQLTGGMRAILVDWLVEVQQNFELHHETLYLAVALTDLFLTKQSVAKDRLQLVGATTLLIASKFEERSPPLVDDFVYICDDTYSRDELLEMERTMLKMIDFDLGIPLSYTFLRRYAQCARVSLPTLTLARYILESSLVEYSYVVQRASVMAAASLLLAMHMSSDGEWDKTMVHYTGYDADRHLSSLARQLNQMLRKAGHNSLKTVHTKYSHKVFHEVTKVQPLSDARVHQCMPLSSLS